MAIKSKVSQAIINLQVTMGFTRNEAIRLNYKNTSERFQKNIVPALIFLQQEMRYKSTDLDNLYGSGSRWYQGVIKKDVSRNIKINTIIKLATAFEMTPGELIDYIIEFGQNKK